VKNFRIGFSGYLGEVGDFRLCNLSWRPRRGPRRRHGHVHGAGDVYARPPPDLQGGRVVTVRHHPVGAGCTGPAGAAAQSCYMPFSEKATLTSNCHCKAVAITFLPQEAISKCLCSILDATELSGHIMNRSKSGLRDELNLRLGR
jgi:hypothetical protein